ncbi:MAG: hypothetical protein A4E43_00791 [Methanosaeta sp. PtaB.Bin005]|nr:MAG: hypothetical protein A4E43_00791 [Methanosaeta sp. PtaB.Bin005]
MKASQVGIEGIDIRPGYNAVGQSCHQAARKAAKSQPPDYPLETDVHPYQAEGSLYLAEEDVVYSHHLQAVYIHDLPVKNGLGNQELILREPSRRDLVPGHIQADIAVDAANAGYG